MDSKREWFVERKNSFQKMVKSLHKFLDKLHFTLLDRSICFIMYKIGVTISSAKYEDYFAWFTTTVTKLMRNYKVKF